MANNIEILQNVSLGGALQFYDGTEFPPNPALGTMILMGEIIYAYITVGGLETWYPFASKTNSYVHTQGLAETTWVIHHNLHTSDIWVQVKNSVGDIISAKTTTIDIDTVEINFTSPVSGTAVIVAPDNIEVPEVKATLIKVGPNVEINTTGVMINGYYALTSASIDTQINSAVAAEATARSNSDTTIINNLNTEIFQRQADSNYLNGLITTETTNRTSADTILQNNIDTKVDKSALGVSVATLVNGVIPSNQLPSYVDDVVEYDTLPQFPAEGIFGIIYVALDTNKTYRWGGSSYVQITSGAVDSVAGKTGVVSLVKGDVGLGNVDNTSDANKPISTATQLALDNKTPISHIGSTGDSHGVATTSVAGFMSATDKTKLDSVESGAQANVPTNLSVGSRSSTDVPILSSTGTTAVLNSASATMAGVMSSSDKSKLDGIETGANNYSLPTASTTTLGGVKVDGSTITINGFGVISGANTYSLPIATGTVLGGVKDGAGVTVNASGVLSVDYGTTAGTAVQGNDTRVTADQAAGTASIRTIGTGALQAAAGNHIHSNATTSTNGFMSATDKTKLDAITGTNTGDQTTITGNAGSATKLQTSRLIAGTSFDGTADISISHTNLTNIGTNTHAQIDTALTRLANTSGTNTGDQTTITGNAGTATKLQTARTINGVSFDGTSNITINAVDSTARIASSEKGVANGVATLDSNGLVLSTQLPSYIDDVLEYANLAALPATGEAGKIYVALDTNKTYRWGGTSYTLITSGAVDSVAGKTGVVTLVKGDVGLGNVDNTTDATKNVLSATKLTTARTIAGSSFDGTANISISYSNLSGLPTLGTAAAKDIPVTGNASTTQVVMGNDSRLSDARPANGGNAATVTTNANLTGVVTSVGNTTSIGAGAITNTMLANSAVANLSGTNSGDETLATIKSKLGITTLSGSNTGDQTITLTGDVTGSGTGSFATTLANSGVAAGTYGSALSIPVVTVDIKGRVTGITTQTLNAGSTTLSGLTDVSITTPSNNQLLQYNSTSGKWLNITPSYITGNQNITVTGDVTGSGTTAIPLTLATITDSGTGSFKKITTNSKGLVTGTAAVAQSDITGLLGAGSITNTMLANTAVANLSGTNSGDETLATIKSKLGITTLSGSNTGDQTITLTGDVTGSGTGSFAATLATTGVSAGTYKSVTVDTKGRVTGGSNPTTLAGYGITDAVNTSSIGAASGIAPLGADSKIAATYLPSYVDDVIEGTNLAAFPATGETGKIYVALDTNKTYRWSGTVYVEISASPGSTDSVTEGTTNLYFTNARAQAAVTSVSGNAGTATKLQTARTISVSNDATGSASFDGSANADITLTLANTTVTAGSYGSATNIPVITVDAKGRITSASNTAVSIPSGSISVTGGDLTMSGTTGTAITNATLATITDSGTGSFKKITVDTKGRVTGTTAVTSADITGTIAANTYQSYSANLTSWAGVTPATGITTFLATPTSANLAAAVTGETGTGSLVFATSPTLVTPNIGVATGTSFNSITGLSAVAGTALGTAAVGTSTAAARADHVHSAALDHLTDVVITTPATNQVLQYNGTNWVNATSSGGTTLADDTTTNANTFYPVLATATTGTMSAAKVSSTKMYFNPSTGTLNSTTFNSLSDENQKDNIETIENALEKTLSLRGVTYTWKDNGIKSTGVIAQEIEKVLPEVVTTNEDGGKSVSYGNIVGLLIEAIKEQQKQIDELKAKLA